MSWDHVEIDITSNVRKLADDTKIGRVINKEKNSQAMQDDLNYSTGKKNGRWILTPIPVSVSGTGYANINHGIN